MERWPEGGKRRRQRRGHKKREGGELYIQLRKKGNEGGRKGGWKEGTEGAKEPAREVKDKPKIVSKT